MTFRRRSLQLYFAAVFYIIGVAAFAYYQFTNEADLLMRDIDNRLYSGAVAVDSLVGPDFHTLHKGMAQFDERADYALALEMTRLARTLGLAYLYTMVADGEKTLFTTSSAVPRELAEGQYQTVYWREYREADPAIHVARATNQPQYAEYTDQWGSFRSVYLPRIATDGTAYVVGADINLQVVQAAKKSSALFVIGSSLAISALGVPLFLLIITSMRSEWRTREKASYCDLLTHLPNRPALEKDLLKAEIPHLVLISIDKFHYITNTYGLAFGDNILCEFAVNLANFHHPQLHHHAAYHVHGNTFAVLIDQDLSEQQEHEIFNGLLRFLHTARYHLPDNTTLSLNTYLGAASRVDDPLNMADLALHRALELNCSYVCIDSTEKAPAVYKENLQQLEMIKAAFEDDRVVPFFHPIVNARTMEIEKYEVLARIVNAAGEVILCPDQFIPLMHHARLYYKLTERLLSKCLDLLHASDIHLSFNFSTYDVIHPSTSKHLLQKVAESGVADRLHFELLETDCLVDDQTLSDYMVKLQKLGCRVGLDDLGRAYSNFDRLTTLPINFVKLDRNVMPRIAEDPELLRLVQRLVALAKKRKITTVAEYCCDEATTRLAASIGVDFLQGFWLAVPEPQPQQRLLCDAVKLVPQSLEE